MFRTNSFFRYYPCPRKLQGKKCHRPYCQYNHDDSKPETITSIHQMVPDFGTTTTNFGVDDFFTNLKPEDIEHYHPTADFVPPPPPPSSSATSSSSSSISDQKTSMLDLEFPKSPPPSPAPDDDDDDKKPEVNLVPKKESSLANKRLANVDDLFVPGKKIRIAHTPAYGVVKKPITNHKARLNPRQVMMERLAKFQPPASYSASTTKQTIVRPISQIQPSCSENTSKSSTSLVKPYQAGTHDKETKRVAHIPAKPANHMNISLTPIPVPSMAKINLKVRMNFVKKIFEELQTHRDSESPESLAEQARDLEKDICLRCKNLTNVYNSLVTSKIMSIRSADTIAAKSQTVQIKHLANNCSIIKKPKITYKNLSDPQLAALLEKLLVPVEELPKLGFPIRDPDTGLAMFPPERPQVVAHQLKPYQDDVTIVCDRCLKQYRNPQQPKPGTCVYHPGHAYNNRRQGTIERVYSCCGNDSESIGCQSSELHVTKGYKFTDTRTGFVQTKSSPGQIPKAYALDCEMCFTEMAFEVCRVTVIDFEGNIIYDELVKPEHKIIDYNTEYSGLRESDFATVQKRLEDVQRDLLKRISAETFVIGHGLDSDFRVLKLYHERVIDTAYLYPHKRGLPFKRALRTLAANFLNKIIQNDVTGGGHNSSEDALAALDLVKLRLQNEIHKHNIV